MTLRTAAIVALAVPTLTIVAACGGATHSASRSPDKLSAGEIGRLPPATTSTPAPQLTLPTPALTVPGRYPLHALVTFRVPVRNDGGRPLRITRIDPG